MTIKTQLLIGIPILAFAFPVGWFIAFFYYAPEEIPREPIKEAIQKAEEPKIEKRTEEKIEVEEYQLPKYNLWTYYFPDYQTGKAVGIEDISLEEARKQAIFMGLGETEVLSTWRQK